jgi:hypothetical protein
MAAGLDLDLVGRLVVEHLRQDGVDASTRGRELRVPPGLTLGLRTDAPVEHDVASMFWIDIDGLRLEPQMQLDVSGWGLTEDAKAIDAAHGILESVLPPVRWLAAEPWVPPADHAGRVLETDETRSRGWTVVAGKPWVVVALDEGAAGDPDALAPQLGAALSGAALATLDPLGRILDGLLDLPRGHWIKVFAGKVGDELQGRIDVTNDLSLDGASFAAALPWLDIAGLQITRQLIVLRPDHEPPRPSPRRFGFLRR